MKSLGAPQGRVSLRFKTKARCLHATRAQSEEFSLQKKTGNSRQATRSLRPDDLDGIP